MSLETDPVLPPELPVKLSPSFPPPVSLSEHSQLDKPCPPVHPKNGHQPHLPPPPPPPPPAANQRVGKRRFSMGVGFKGVAKRRRRANSDSQAEPVLPSHFLLGGNIFDPLNLNSLLDDEVNRATNQETPQCSPLPSRSRDAVEILVPRDIRDPLNLNAGGEDGDAAGVLVSPVKSRRRNRNRHHGGGGGGGGGGGEKEIPARLFPLSAGLSVPYSPLSCELNTAITCRDDIAPPPILPRRHTHPPPGPAQKPGNHRWRRRAASTRSADGATVATETIALPTKFQTPLVGGAKAGRCVGLQLGSALSLEKKDKQRYQHGNHCRYYGYHGFYGERQEGRVGAVEDPRLRLLEADWFRDKTALDIGCGSGHMTLAIARTFNPAHILGVELDGRLVHAANQNIRHFMSHDLVVEDRGRGEGGMQVMPLPLCFRVSRGPLSAPPLLPSSSSSSSSSFPSNVTFIKGDYVSEREAWPGRGHYDVIMCLGVTKWVQLQSGDKGVVRLFKRAYQSLSPGGVLILEPQPWSSYVHSKRASETTFRNFRTLKIRPELFTSLLTDTVGFSSYRLLTHTGNQRPVYLFHKGSPHSK